MVPLTSGGDQIVCWIWLVKRGNRSLLPPLGLSGCLVTLTSWESELNQPEVWWLVSARWANHTSLTPSSLRDATTATTWLKASHNLYDIQSLWCRVSNYPCSLKPFVSSLGLAAAISHRLTTPVYVNRVKWVTGSHSKVALQRFTHTCFMVERLTLNLGFKQREKAQAASMIWPSWPLRLDSICLLSDIVYFTPGNPLSSVTPFMVSGVHSDSSRSDPERPRGPAVHKPYVWNSKPFTIACSASEFLTDQSLCLGFETQSHSIYFIYKPFLGAYDGII